MSIWHIDQYLSIDFEGFFSYARKREIWPTYTRFGSYIILR